MPTVRANGIDIYYERHGDGPGRPLVFTHGFAGPTDNWRPEALPVAAGRTLVLYDVRGHGRTAVPENPEAYSLPAFAADLAALLAAIGIERAHVGGVSMGGMIAAQFAVDYPQSLESLVLCDTTAGNASTLRLGSGQASLSTGGADEGPAGEWERRLANGARALAHIAAEYGLEETVRRQHEWDRANNPHVDVSPYDPANDFERIKLMTLDGYVGSALAMAGRPDLTSRLPAIAAPALVMVGEWDDFLPCARRDHALIPGSRLVVRRRCGHGTLWRHETFVREVRSFLEDVEAGRPLVGERAV